MNEAVLKKENNLTKEDLLKIGESLFIVHPKEAKAIFNRLVGKIAENK